MSDYLKDRQFFAKRNGETFHEIWILCPHCGARQIFAPNRQEIEPLSWQALECGICGDLFSYQYEIVYSTSKNV